MLQQYFTLRVISQSDKRKIKQQKLSSGSSFYFKFSSQGVKEIVFTILWGRCIHIYRVCI